MQRIARPEGFRSLRACSFARQRSPVCRPERPVTLDRALDSRLVDGLEQTAAKHLDGLVLLGRIQERRLARRNALRLRHGVGDEPVLLGVGIGRPAVLPNRKGVDESGVGGTFHRLEQRSQERRQLIAGIVDAAYLAQVDRELVEQDQGRLASEQLAQRLGAGCDATLVARAHPRIAVLAGQGMGNLVPRGIGQHAAAHRPAIGRIGVLAVEGGDADTTAWEQGSIDELPDVRHAFRPRAAWVNAISPWVLPPP